MKRELPYCREDTFPYTQREPQYMAAPGSYSLINLNLKKHIQLSPVQKTSQKPKKQSKVFPGPGHYDPIKYQLNNQAPLLYTSDKQNTSLIQKIGSDDSVGPGKYDINSFLDDKKFKIKEFDTDFSLKNIKKQQNFSQYYYDIPSQLSKKCLSVLKENSNQRRIPKFIQNTEYNYDIPTSLNQKGALLLERFERDYSNISPGPIYDFYFNQQKVTIYINKLQLLKKNNRINNKKDFHNNEPYLNTQTTRNRYDGNYKGFFKIPIDEQYQFQNIEKNILSNRSFLIGKSKRGEINQFSDLPGPGKYDNKGFFDMLAEKNKKAKNHNSLLKLSSILNTSRSKDKLIHTNFSQNLLLSNNSIDYNQSESQMLPKNNSQNNIESSFQKSKSDRNFELGIFFNKRISVQQNQSQQKIEIPGPGNYFLEDNFKRENKLFLSKSEKKTIFDIKFQYNNENKHDIVTQFDIKPINKVQKLRQYRKFMSQNYQQQLDKKTINNSENLFPDEQILREVIKLQDDLDLQKEKCKL